MKPAARPDERLTMTNQSRPAVSRAVAAKRGRLRARLAVVMRTARRHGLYSAADFDDVPRDKLLALEIEVHKLKHAVGVLASGEATRASRELSRLAELISAVRRRHKPVRDRPTVSPSRTWADIRTDLVVALNDQWADSIRIVPGGRDRTPIRIDRVLDRGGLCVAWVVLRTAESARRLEAAGWTLWRPDWPIETRKQRGRVTAADCDTYRVVVATTRGGQISVFATAVCDRLRNAATDPAELSVKADECDPLEYRRRMAALRIVERTRQASVRAAGGDVLTHCLRCGRPLTDHGSAKSGYGPVCAGRATGIGAPAPAARADLDTVFRVAGKPIEQWRRHVRDVAGSLDERKTDP